MRLLILLPLLTGCVTDQGLMLRDAFVQRAASAYDEKLNNAELWMCRGGSVASVLRAYATSEERWEAWLTLCGYVSGKTLVRPETGEGEIPL